MKMNNFVTFRLIALLVGCGPSYSVKEESVATHLTPTSDSPIQEISVKPVKIPVDIYFDPLCIHCDVYSQMIKEKRLEERFADYDFHYICVEMFGADGRCERKY